MFRHNKKNVSRPQRIFPLVALVALTLSLSGCGKKEEAPPPPPPLPVTVLTMQPQNVPYVLEIMAQTEGAKEAEVRARVGGILEKQLYQEGEWVKEGQALFQIDRAPYLIALAEARARASQSAHDLERMKKLIEVNGISRKEYDDATSANDMAQALLRQAELNLSWTTVTAPVAGVSGRAVQSVGNLIGTGAESLLTTVYQNNPIWVRFSLAENEIAKLPNGKLTPDAITGVELVLPDGSTYPQKGRLNFVASSIDTVLGTRQLRAEFPNVDDALLPGQFVRARLLVGEHQGVYLVPQVAIMQTNEGDIVMVADQNNHIQPRPIQTGDWYGKDWIVLSGLAPGDRVIIDNLLKLKPGNPVAPHGPSEPPKASPPPQQPTGAGAAKPHDPNEPPQASPPQGEAAPEKQQG